MNPTDPSPIQSQPPTAAACATADNKFQKFLELRAQGHSLATISRLIAVPKSTLYGWNIRNRETIDRLKRIEMEALEERILGSSQEQFAALGNMLKNLQTTFARKLRDFEDDLSLTELFWMAANLRQQVQHLRDHQALTDRPDPHPPADGTAVPSDENTTLPN